MPAPGPRPRQAAGCPLLGPCSASLPAGETRPGLPVPAPAGSHLLESPRQIPPGVPCPREESGPCPLKNTERGGAGSCEIFVS